MDKKIFTFLFYTVSFLCLILIFTYLRFPMVSADSGYYLAVARDLYAGNIYFLDIGISYNPLSIVTFGIPFLFDETPHYSWHLAINIIVVIASSIVFYKILEFISSIKIYNLFFTSLFVLLSLFLDGRYVLLEPLSVFFQLLALYSYLEFIKTSDVRKILLVGISICLAFLSKQYGLFIAIPIGVDFIMRKKFNLRHFFILILGFLIPLFLFFSYLFYNGVGFSSFIKYILGKGVELDMGNGTGINYSFSIFLLGFIYILKCNLYVLLIPILYIKNLRKLDDRRFLFPLLAMSSLVVLYFAGYVHYYQYIIPYCIIVFVYLFKEVRIRAQRALIGLLFGASLIFITYTSVSDWEYIDLNRETNQEVTSTLSEIIEPESKVYLDGLSPSFYYLCNFKSINLKSIGYSFSGYFFPKTILHNLTQGAYLIVSRNKFENYKNDIEEYSLEEITLANKEYIIIKKDY
jgi:hypothetical protein